MLIVILGPRLRGMIFHIMLLEINFPLILPDTTGKETWKLYSAIMPDMPTVGRIFRKCPFTCLTLIF